MATSEDTHETQDVPTDFNFDEWAASLNLSRKITQVLRQEELTSKEALSLIELKDLKELSFPMETTKVIMSDINKWKIVNVDTEHNVQSSQTWNMGQLKGAGKSFDSLLNEFQAPRAESFTSSPPTEWGNIDPRTILTMKAQSSKAVHITSYITEQCKCQRQNRRKEFVIKSGSEDTETLVLLSDDEHPYLGIFIEEWGVANMRLLNHLLCTGQLPRADIEFYLAYTTKIYEFAEKYKWSSVLNYDYNYRELHISLNGAHSLHTLNSSCWCPNTRNNLMFKVVDQTIPASQSEKTANCSKQEEAALLGHLANFDILGPSKGIIRTRIRIRRFNKKTH